MGSNQVNWNRTPAVGDGVALPVNLNGAGGGEATEIQFLEKGEQPAFPAFSGRGFARLFGGNGAQEIRPASLEAVPAPVYLIADPLSGRKTVSSGVKPFYVRLRVGKLGKEVSRQEAALGGYACKDMGAWHGYTSLTTGRRT
jgi:hypothetical protein